MNYSVKSIKTLSEKLRHDGKKIVLATGFFDLLHSEHINFLKNAKEVGDILIVAVESDNRAKEIKGNGRPVETQSIRCEKVSKYADYVIALDDTFNNQKAYESLINAVRPKIYAVSSHTSYKENKENITEKYGGHLKVVHEFNPEVSTSKIIASQQNQV